MDEVLKVLAEKLSEEETCIKEDLSMGRAKEYAHYMHSCGIVRGLQISQGIIADMLRNMEVNDE